MEDPSRQNVLAHIDIDYLNELKYPADVEVGVRVLQIGRSSFQLGLGLFSGGRCMATARSVQVRIDAHSKAPIPLEAADREALQPYLATPA
jgi:acyl-CoA thioester hydrolase